MGLLASYGDEYGLPLLCNVTTSHMEEYLLYLRQRPKWFGVRTTQEKLSASYIETQYRRLKAFFAYAVTRDYIEKNPFDLIDHPSVPKKTMPLVPLKVAEGLLELTDPRHYHTKEKKFLALRNRAILLLLWDTPVRRAELANLTLGDVDLDKGTIHVMGKGAKERLMPIGDAAVEAIWEYMRGRKDYAGPKSYDALWLTRWGRPMSPDQLAKRIKRLGILADAPWLRPHLFRHRWTVDALRSGMPSPLVKHNGGWTKEIPETYLRTVNDEDVAIFQRANSPADKLTRYKDVVQENRDQPRKGNARGRL